MQNEVPNNFSNNVHPEDMVSRAKVALGVVGQRPQLPAEMMTDEAPPMLNKVERKTIVPQPGFPRGSVYYGKETAQEHWDRIAPWREAQRTKTFGEMKMIQQKFRRIARNMGVNLDDK